MYWIETQQGALVNMALASDVQVTLHSDPSKDKKQVKAFFPGSGETADYSVLFTGTAEECRAYLNGLRDELMARNQPAM